MFGKAATHRFTANRLDLHAPKRLNQIVHDAFLIDTIVRTEATPEAPTHPLQDALPPHIICPTFRAVIAVTVAFDGKAPPAFTLDHHVNGKTYRSDLRNYAIAALYKCHKHRAFEFRLAEVHEFGTRIDIIGPRFAEVSDDLRFQVLGIQFFLFHGSDQHHPIPCPR